jgi:hypothetical protein
MGPTNTQAKSDDEYHIESPNQSYSPIQMYDNFGKKIKTLTLRSYSIANLCT